MNISSNYKTPIAAASSIVAGAIIIGVLVFAYTAYGIRSMDNQLSVTGSARQSIVADKAKWTVSITRPVTASTLKAGYADMSNDLKVVLAYFSRNGFDQSALTVSTVFMEEVYENYQPAPDQKKYTLRQSVELASDDVEKVSALSKNVQEIINQGVILNAMSPEYSYSKLADLRVSLLSQALKDAKDRASAISEMSGNRVGKLKSAASGVVQVLPPGSIEVSDYGAYDTSSINKEVMVTVRASFSLK
ncbi:MAG TPA: SIMPL domain-containing protein [Candidatus Paceibacterota bacterium]